MFVFRKEHFHILVKDKVSVFITFLIEAFVVFVAIVLKILESIYFTIANFYVWFWGINHKGWFVVFLFAPVQLSKPLDRISSFLVVWVVFDNFKVGVILWSIFLRKPFRFGIRKCIWRRNSSFYINICLIVLFVLDFSQNWFFLLHVNFFIITRFL